MTKPEKSPFEDADRLLLPLWTRMDEFEEFLVMSEKIFHVTDLIDNPGEHWTDYMYYYDIDWNNIIVKCIFYQRYSREEDEKERTETTYIWVDKIFTKWVDWRDLWDKYDTYEDWKLTKDQQEWHDELVRLNTPHLIEDDNKSRTPEAIAKIKSFLFYQTLWKEKAKELIENEIKSLWENVQEDDLAELNEIKETWKIKRGKHYMMLYCLRNMREMAKDSPHAKDLEEHIKLLEEDEKNNPN